MKVRLAVITTTLIAFVIGCGESTVTDIVSDAEVEVIETNQAELKVEPEAVVEPVELADAGKNEPADVDDAQPIEPEPEALPPREISFKVVETLEWEGRGGIPGVKVTPIEGSNEGPKETTPFVFTLEGHLDKHGKVTFFGTLPLTVRLEKEGFVTTEVTVTKEHGEFFVLPSQQKNITFWVKGKRNLDGTREAVPGVKVTPLEGSDEGPKETAADGSVTFFGTTPLVVKFEKEGYVAQPWVLVSQGLLETDATHIILKEPWDITFRVVDGNGNGIEGVKVTTIVPRNEAKTAADGSVTVRGTIPLAVELEKNGVVKAAKITKTEGGEITFRVK